MIAFLRRVRSDRDGAAAMEFALIFPIIFMLYMGATEAFSAYQAQRNVSHIAAAMADITAQSRSVTASDLNDIMSASEAMMYPLTTARLQQRIASVSANGSGAVSSDWNATRNYTGGAAPTVPAGYLAANESVIVTEVAYDYRPAIGFFMPEEIRITRRAYSRPRLTAKVERVN